jgi:hypothetical protein
MNRSTQIIRRSPSLPTRDPGKKSPSGSTALHGGEFENSSLYALYRSYEYIVLDKLFAYRSNLEWYW